MLAVCLIHSSIDVDLDLSGLNCYFHSAFTFLKVKDSIIAFLAPGSDILFSTAKVNPFKKSRKVSFGPCMT